MVQVSRRSEAGLRDGLLAANLAVGGFAQACRGLAEQAPSPAARAAAEAALRRLDAIRRDLAGRLRPAANADVYFVALGVLQAGLVGVADAVRETRQAVDAAHPRPDLPQGWFVEGDDPPEA